MLGQRNTLAVTGSLSALSCSAALAVAGLGRQILPTDFPGSIWICHTTPMGEQGPFTCVLCAPNGGQRKGRPRTRKVLDPITNALRCPAGICFAHSSSGCSESPLSLLSAAPSFVEELLDQAVTSGQCVTLSCRTAQPNLHISWFRGDTATPPECP